VQDRSATIVSAQVYSSAGQQADGGRTAHGGKGNEAPAHDPVGLPPREQLGRAESGLLSRQAPAGAVFAVGGGGAASV